MIIGIASADYMRSDRTSSGNDEWGGAGWARMGQYIDQYTKAGHDVICGTLFGGKVGAAVEDGNGVKKFPDIILMQRLMHSDQEYSQVTGQMFTKEMSLTQVMAAAKKSGQVIVNDVDDWYWGIDPSNFAFMGSHPKVNAVENTRNYSAVLASSSLLTVSTPYLAERLRTRVRCPIVVIPNYIEVSRFTPHQQSIGVPMFGWAGSTGHRSRDIETVAGVLRPRILDGSILMQHSGDHPSSRPLHAMLGVEDALVARVPRTNAAGYPSILNFDVGIVPLRDTPFNHAKSDIKGLEYAASGIPFIAQDLTNYKSLHKAWEGAFHLANRPKDWIAGIKRYQDYYKRVDDGAALLDWVQGRDIRYGVASWLQLLEGLTS